MKAKITKQILTGLILAIALTAAVAAPVLAGLRVTGARIEQPVYPGESITTVINVGDNTDAPMDIAVDVKGLGNYLNGVTQSLTPEEDLSPYSARTFVTASPTSFHLEPGESQNVNVAISVPYDVGDGGRYAIVLIRTIPQGTGIVFSTAVATQVLLTVQNSSLIISGDITSIGIPQAESEQLFSATATIQNTGNYHYKIVCNGTVKNNLGQIVGLSWPTDSVYNLIPTFSRQIDIPLNISQELTPGTYSLEIEAYTQDGIFLDASSTTFVLTGTYKPMPLNPLAIEFWDSGKLSMYQWDMAEDGTLMEKVEATSLTQTVSIDILQGTKVLGENGQPPAPITVTALDPPPSPPTGYNTVTAFDFSPEGITFDPKADITFEYSPADIEGVNESQLKIETLDEDTWQWIPVDSEIDTDANTITFPVTHFSVYALFAPPPASPTTIAGIDKQTWLWIGIGVLWVVVLTFAIGMIQRRRSQSHKDKNRRRRRVARPQGPRDDNW